VGAGAKGRWRFEWAAVPINHPYDPRRWQRCLLMLCRRCDNPEDLAFYLAFGPAGTSLEVLARVAGRRWAIEEAFAQDKGEVGLDQYEVRSWVGWHRHMTPATMALALLVLTRARLFGRPAGEVAPLCAMTFGYPPLLFARFVPTTVVGYLLVSFDLLHPPTLVSLASLGPGVSLDDNRQKTPVPLIGTPSAYVSPTTMAHYLDSAIARRDVRLDITDLYLFRGETGTVFVINVCHSIAGEIPTPG
jgi:hypothetical protein